MRTEEINGAYRAAVLSGEGIAQAGSDPVMTLEEIADYLKVSEKTILRMVRAGELPGLKVSNQWRFLRAAIDDWLSARMYAAPRKSLIGVIGTAAETIPIQNLISPGRMILDLRPGSKTEILRQLTRPLLAGGLIDGEADYLRRLLAREAIVSTAIGHGFAVPHVRDPDETTIKAACIVLGVCREGTDFASLDGEKTFVFAMPCSGSEAEHLQLLARTALVFRKPGLLNEIRGAATREAVMKILTSADEELMSPSMSDPDR